MRSNVAFVVLGVNRVAVTESGIVLVAGAGGVQRSEDTGYTWKRTLIPESLDQEVRETQ